ncbi:WD-repeat protein [Reticulomyxa filosa]|uniref:WD-repeat protein n=1 Tax=Reticulomyxa filosa TaxID=46433 RepID=X6MHS2_RETFI|nr:WD-repeat protein [Reticulomyxa filosa]|eukprot:ETO13216.1 WD-repeat protein [Reticulomyxa filosa]
MSKVGDNKTPKEVKTEMMPVPIEQSCFDKNWILQLNQSEQIKNIICIICKQVANNPIEIDCPQHRGLYESLLVGENCLKQFLNANPNSCPVQPHDGCVYSRNSGTQRLIDTLKVMCPLRLQQYAQTPIQGQQEGENNNQVMCNFKGTIDELNNHLNNVCPLKMSDCWYKPFGCEHTCPKYKLQEHLVLDVKFHFDLVVKFVTVLQEEIKQLKLQLNKKKKNEDNTMPTNDNILLHKKEIVQLQHNVSRANSQREILEKENEMKKLQRESHKNYSNFKDFIEREKHYNESIKVLQEKSEKPINTEEMKDNDSPLSFDPKCSSSFSFDLFCSSSKLLKTFSGHTNTVWGIDCSTFDDCQFLCSGSHNNTIRVWNVETTKQIQFFSGHSRHVYSVKFSPFHDHSIICSSSFDKTIRFWNFETAKELQVLNEHTGWVSGIAFSPFNKGRYLCSGSADKTIRLWDVETFQTLHIFNGHEHGVWCVDILPLQSNHHDDKHIGVIGGNGYTLCSGACDKTIRIWDIETAKELIIFKGHGDTVRSVKYSPCGTNTILSGSDDSSVRMWDIRSKKEIHVFKGHTDTTWSVGYSPFVRSGKNSDDTNIIYSGSSDNTIRFWDTRTNKKLHMIKGNDEDGGIISLQFLFLKNKEKRNKNTDNCVYSANLCYGSSKGPVRVWG